MKIGILGDTHYTNRAPLRRIDDYFQTQMRKSTQALTIFEEMGCDIVVQPGDLFDASTAANRVKSAIITLIKQYNRKIYCIWGQHDVTGHSKATLPNSPLAVLEAAEVIKILDNEPLRVGSVSKEDGTRVYLYGAGFGEDIPKPYEDGYNILVAHRMVGNKPLWPGQELVGPRTFLRRHLNFNLCIFGDYHYQFVEKWNGRTAVNVGALVRKTIGKFDLEHKPAVGVFDTSNDNLKIIELDVEPVEKVFDLSREVKTTDSSVLAELVEKLKRGSNKLVGWKSKLLSVFEERKSNSSV